MIKLQKNLSIKFATLGLSLLSLYSCGEGDMKQANFKLNMLRDPDYVELRYPIAEKGNVVDHYFGLPIADPYRWMEGADSADKAKLEVWLDEEHKLAQNYLQAIPLRSALKKRFEKVWNYERFGTPFKEGDNYYFYHNSGLQNQSVLYKLKDLNAQPEVLLDPNNFSEKGTMALQQIAFSKDGKYMAFAVAKGGSDWSEINIMNTATKEVLADKIDWVRYSAIHWFEDGFFYSRYPAVPEGENMYTYKNIFHEVYYHKLGTKQEDDELIYADRENPDNLHDLSLVESQEYAVLSISPNTASNKLLVKSMKNTEDDFNTLIIVENASSRVIDNDGNQFFVLTNAGAANYKLVKIAAGDANQNQWKTILPEDKNRVLQGVYVAKNYLLAQYMKDATHQLELYDRNGKFVQKIDIPDDNKLVNINSIECKKDSDIILFRAASFTKANTVYQYDLNTKKASIWKETQTAFKAEDYVSKQIFYTSKDGTKVPMFLVYKKDILLDGNNPTLLYGYGGFQIPLLPSFSVERIPFLENGGIIAIANLRGGGEYGSKWHDGGRLLNKQNVFDDFIAAAEWLIAEKYTSKHKLAIEGRSNGGLLVGACITQRPDLFKVAIPAVGVLDMLRYQLFGVGFAWAYDYGLSTEEVHFRNLIKYSPVHNVRANNYPATLVMTAEFDDRVVPAHSYKFTAALQANQQRSNNPILLRLDRDAGHGAGMSTEQLINAATDKYSFILFNLGVK